MGARDPVGAPFSDLLEIKPFCEHQASRQREEARETDILRKHAVQVRKRLFIASMNEALRLKEAKEEIRPIFDTIGDQLYKVDLNGQQTEKGIYRTANAPEFDHSASHLESDPQLVNYFAHNLPLLWQLGRSKK